MSGISDALNSSANNLRSLNRSLLIIQSNVGNASTPGYARQDIGAALDSASAADRQQVSASVDSINHLAGLIRDFNGSQRDSSGAVSDPNVDAKLHATIEQLSEFGNVQTLRQNDGTLTVLLDGQTPLVVGTQQ